MKLMKVLVLVVLVGVLGWAGMQKLLDRHSFLLDVHGFGMWSPGVARWIVIVLPGLELVTAVSLVFGSVRRAGAVLAAGLFVVFSVIVGVVLARGMDLSCGCFGPSELRIGSVHLMGVMLLAGCAVWIAWSPHLLGGRALPRPDPGHGGGRHP